MRKTIYWIEGDGIGPDVWKAARPVIDAAVRHAYGEERALEWKELLAGEKALKETGTLLPDDTLEALRHAELAIKGPLGTPVGTGFRSLNVTLRQTLDLYACIRPIRAFPGIAKRLVAFLRDELGADVDAAAAVGIKPMTERASKRLTRAAIRHALEHGLPSVTLVHKGNIMKYTEGAFRRYGYDVAATDRTVTEADLRAGKANAAGKVIVRDRIADAMFQEALLHPETYSVLATPNLNGDYLSDALAAQVGGLGLAPGVNRSDTLAFFEATHGTAPNLAGTDRANPGSLILCGALMLEHMGWNEAANRLNNAMNTILAAGSLTEDLAAQTAGARTVGCTEFGELVQQAL